jgi:hypothetical protein
MVRHPWVSKEKYYGSLLNQFFSENCSPEMTCMNIDTYLLKVSKRKALLIEYKQKNEMPCPRSQLTALGILETALERSSTNFQFKLRILRGDYPFADGAEVSTVRNPEEPVTLSRQELINCLNFDSELPI